MSGLVAESIRSETFWFGRTCSKPEDRAARDGGEGTADKAAAAPAKQQKTVRTAPAVNCN